VAVFPPVQVLVVDDEDVVRRYVYRLLNSAGFRVYECQDVAEALMVLDTMRSPVDLVILDVRMPVNGVEMAKLIRNRRPDQRLMFMSAYPAELIAKLGGDEELEYPFLAKPFTRDELFVKVREALHRAPRSKKSGSPPPKWASRETPPNPE
jgi:DNA-binding response OmpR family regulator